MIYQKCSEEDVEFAGVFYDPVALCELLFTSELKNFESLKNYSETECASIRLYQIPMMSYEYLIVDDPTLSKDDNFALKKGAGTLYAYCGRKIGKSLVSLLMDMLLDTLHNFEDWVSAFSSLDEAHVWNVLDPYISVLKQHKFFKFFNENKSIQIQRKKMSVTTASGHTLRGVNMTLQSGAPGKAWESVHATKIYQDEHQYETDEVVEKRSQAVSEFGAIERFVGITNFARNSPAGNIFTDLNKRNWLVNLPQTVSPLFTDKLKREAIADYQGEDSVPYQIHVLAKLIENAEGLYDMDKIQACYLDNIQRPIKRFDITKENFVRYRDILRIDPHKDVTSVWISGDFGEKVTEAIILFGFTGPDGREHYKYEYGITCYNLILEDQKPLFKYIIEKLAPNFVTFDSTEVGGKSLVRFLQAEFKNTDTIQFVDFNSKMVVDYEKNSKGETVFEAGKPVPVEEYTIDWAVHCLKDLFYGGLIDARYDYKLDKQFGAMLCAATGRRLRYWSRTTEDHLHAAWEAFGISWFKNAMTIAKKIQTPFIRSLGV